MSLVSKTQTLCRMIQVLLALSNGKTRRLLKLLLFIYKCAGILLTTQWVLATPILIGLVDFLKQCTDDDDI